MALWLSLPSAATSYLPVYEMENQGVPVITPIEQVEFAHVTEPGDVMLSADGSRVVYTEFAQVTNVTQALLSIWPEILLVLLGLWLPWRVWASLRRRRRFPAERGPFCAKCAYPTEGLSADHCPECGKALTGKGVTKGISRGRAVAWGTAWIMLGYVFLVIYASGELPREWDANRWPRWYSEDLASWAQQNQIDWLIEFEQASTAVRSFSFQDTSTRKTQGHVLWKSQLHTTYYSTNPMFSHPHTMLENEPNTHLFITTDDRFGVFSLDKLEMTRTGKITEDYDSYWHLSRDASFRFGPNWVGEQKIWSAEDLDGANERELSTTKEHLIEIPIRCRSPRTLHLQLSGDEDVEPDPYEEGVLEIHALYFGDEVDYDVSSNKLIFGYVQAGYATVNNARSVMLFDIAKQQWVAELDISRLTPMQFGGKIVSTFISSDRKTVVVSKNNGNKTAFAIYKLP